MRIILLLLLHFFSFAYSQRKDSVRFFDCATKYPDFISLVLICEESIGYSNTLANNYQCPFFRLPDSLGGDSLAGSCTWRVFLDKKNQVKGIKIEDMLLYRQPLTSNQMWALRWMGTPQGAEAGVVFFQIIDGKVKENGLSLSKESYESYLLSISKKYSFYVVKRGLFSTSYFSFDGRFTPCAPDFDTWWKESSDDVEVTKMNERIKQMKK